MGHIDQAVYLNAQAAMGCNMTDHKYLFDLVGLVILLVESAAQPLFCRFLLFQSELDALHLPL